MVQRRDRSGTASPCDKSMSLWRTACQSGPVQRRHLSRSSTQPVSRRAVHTTQDRNHTIWNVCSTRLHLAQFRHCYRPRRLLGALHLQSPATAHGALPSSVHFCKCLVLHLSMPWLSLICFPGHSLFTLAMPAAQPHFTIFSQTRHCDGRRQPNMDA